MKSLRISCQLFLYHTKSIYEFAAVTIFAKRKGKAKRKAFGFQQSICEFALLPSLLKGKGKRKAFGFQQSICEFAAVTIFAKRKGKAKRKAFGFQESIYEFAAVTIFAKRKGKTKRKAFGCSAKITLRTVRSTQKKLVPLVRAFFVFVYISQKPISRTWLG